jgi:hypothetical protein
VGHDTLFEGTLLLLLLLGERRQCCRVAATPAQVHDAVGDDALGGLCLRASVAACRQAQGR